MKQNGKTFLSEFIADRKKRRRALKVTFLLSVLIIPAIFWGFRFTGVTLSGEDPTFCGIEEHVHSAECIAAATETGEQPALASEPHVHTAECYETERVLLCEEEERADHEHSAAAGCYEEDAEADLICTTPEEGHTHTEDCYETTEVLVCGLEEGEVVATETTSESASPAEAGAANQETVYTCGQKEHVHISECYSNKEADLETAAIWEETFADVELTGDWGEDLLAIALTQIGYRESSANYELVYKGENTVKQGYTRYGQWYGAPYSDWCAMFVSFVLHYADIPQEAVPYHAGCYSWVEEFEELELYQAVDSPLPQSEDAEAQEVEEPYLPQPGDIIFFDVEDNGLPGHVGIVEDVIDKQSGESLIDILTEAEAADEELDLENDFELELHTIEGNSANMVRRKTYELRDPVIHGYVSLDQAYEQYLELLILRGETLPGFDLEPGDTLINLSATTAEGVTVELNGPTSSFGLPEDVPAADLELRLTVEELFDPADEEQSRDSLMASCRIN